MASLRVKLKVKSNEKKNWLNCCHLHIEITFIKYGEIYFFYFYIKAISGFTQTRKTESVGQLSVLELTKTHWNTGESPRRLNTIN